MKRITLFLVSLFLVAASLHAQQNKQVTKEQLELFKKSTTYVVMDNDPLLGYNITVKSAMEKYWKITPFKFISTDEFESQRKDKTKSFLLLTRTTLTKDKENTDYLYMNLLMGDNVENINDMPEILTLPISYTGVEENSYVYKMGVMVRFAQEHAKTLLASDRITQYRDLKYYNRNIRDIKKKILLLEKSDLAEEVNTIEKIKAIYPYDVRIVSSSEIEKAVMDRTPNTLIAHQISPGPEDKIGRCYKIIYGVDDNKIYYYYFVKISDVRPSGFLAFDFKRFNVGL
ncbi:MAG TPA: hypothetical protein VIH57_10390 [Bacteroidales bacterium]